MRSLDCLLIEYLSFNGLFRTKFLYYIILELHTFGCSQTVDVQILLNLRAFWHNFQKHLTCLLKLLIQLFWSGRASALLRELFIFSIMFFWSSIVLMINHVYKNLITWFSSISNKIWYQFRIHLRKFYL